MGNPPFITQPLNLKLNRLFPDSPLPCCPSGWDHPAADPAAKSSTWPRSTKTPTTTPTPSTTTFPFWNWPRTSPTQSPNPCPSPTPAPTSPPASPQWWPDGAPPRKEAAYPPNSRPCRCRSSRRLHAEQPTEPRPSPTGWSAPVSLRVARTLARVTPVVRWLLTVTWLVSCLGVTDAPVQTIREFTPAYQTWGATLHKSPDFNMFFLCLYVNKILYS